ncbi:hypothetical protein NC653_008705 [Populus alba x Populus x berolinensis]|uniref:Uncharacterized protein n=1 Tax=Populus alba x Populus x berolinensis TaxID=444605 RepID=A0AAD6R8B3_9ROSI|nr:hypothetical protein NC653_008705 [Populus alba x Populus x berolinensis]
MQMSSTCKLKYLIRFTISWPVLLESLQFFCVNYTVKLLDRDATQGSGPAAQHPCRKATFLLATMWWAFIFTSVNCRITFYKCVLNSYWNFTIFLFSMVSFRVRKVEFRIRCLLIVGLGEEFRERTPKNTAIESHFNCDQYLLCFPGHFGSSIQKSPCTRDSDVLCAQKKLLRILQAVLDGRRTRKNGNLSVRETLRYD